MTTDIQVLENTLPFPVEDNNGPSGGLMRWSFLGLLGAASDIIPAYWSQSRDSFLRKFYSESDPLKITVGTFIHKVSTIPVTVTARDRSVNKHVRQALVMNNNLVVQTGIFRGLRYELEKVVNDYLTQDKGCFTLVMGDGRPDGPIIGPAQGLYHLDAAFCDLTGDPTYPVIYNHENGSSYKLHYTRIIHIVNLPSPKRGLFGVGMCPTSSCIDSGRELKDIVVNSQESFGSRPARKALYVKKGATLDQLQGAVNAADQKMDSEGLTRFAKTLLLAPKNPNSELELDTLDLAAAPDGFNRKDVSLFDMAFMAAAFGLNLNDLALAFMGGASSNSQVDNSDRKGWGKGVALFIDLFADQLNMKFLPPYLRVNTDNVDDEQDKQQAEIRQIRSAARQRDLQSGVTTVRVERERMLDAHEITDEQFADMELLDGRLPNGLDVFSLFVSEEPLLTELLDLGVEDPTVTNKNDPTTMLDAIHEKTKLAWQLITDSTNSDTSRTIRYALAALEKLRAMYQTEYELAQAMMMQPLGNGIDGSNPDPTAVQPTSGDSQVVDPQTQQESADANHQTETSPVT